jgi:hypothetical protein
MGFLIFFCVLMVMLEDWVSGESIGRELEFVDVQC